MMMLISLSILEYEPDLKDHLDSLAASEGLTQIIRLIQTGKIHRVHMDVMRPPMIPDKTKFPVELMKRLHEELHERILLAAHLMVQNPFPIIRKINEFIPKKERKKTSIIIQVESFSSEEETVEALSLLKEYGYKAGICLNLLTPRETLTKKTVENADTVLLMSVPMGSGGQEYSPEATKRITQLSQNFPNKTIEVDGGLNPQTIASAKKAGARVAVVGSFITRNEDPKKAILELERSLEN